MDGAEFIEQFRQETLSDAAPSLWADSLILRYLEEAQNEFCRRTDGLEDSTSAVCTLSLEAGTRTVRLSPKILKVRAAYLRELIPGLPTRRSRPLQLLSLEQARAEGIGQDLPAQEPGLGWGYPDAGRGLPHSLILSTSQAGAQLHPTPRNDAVLELDVFRMPLRRIVDPSDELEVPEHYAPVLMKYVLYRAYSRLDPETMERVRAEDFVGRFAADCAQVRREQGRARRPAGTTQFSW